MACLEVVHGRDGACRAIRGKLPCKQTMLRIDDSGEITKARVRAERGNGPSVFCSLGHHSGAVRISVWQRRVLVLLVPKSGQSNHAPNLFFHQTFIPQPRDCQTGRRGIDSLLGQDHKLIAILFVAENEREEKTVPNVLHRHDAILGI